MIVDDRQQPPRPAQKQVGVPTCQCKEAKIAKNENITNARMIFMIAFIYDR